MQIFAHWIFWFGLLVGQNNQIWRHHSIFTLLTHSKPKVQQLLVCLMFTVSSSTFPASLCVPSSTNTWAYWPRSSLRPSSSSPSPPHASQTTQTETCPPSSSTLRERWRRSSLAHLCSEEWTSKLMVGCDFYSEKDFKHTLEIFRAIIVYWKYCCSDNEVMFFEELFNPSVSEIMDMYGFL